MSLLANKSLKVCHFAIFSALMLVAPALAQASTYYVTKSGSDSNSCSSAQDYSRARLTLAGGIACLSRGDTLIVGNGTYSEQITDNIPSGYSGAPTTIQAENSNGVRVVPSRGGRFIAAVSIYNRSYITLDGLDADAANTEQPYYIYYSSNITMQNGTARNGRGTYGSGIELRASSYNTVTNMDIRDNGTGTMAHGIYIAGEGNTIDGNRVYGNSGYGIHVYGGSSVRYNTISGNEVFRNIWGSAIIIGGPGNSFYDNVIYSNGPKGLR